MNPKAVAGVTGVIGLAVVGFIGHNYNTQSRARRDLLVVDDNDYGVEVDDLNSDFFDEWSDDFENGTDLWRQFNKDIGIEISEDDVMLKQDGRKGGGRGKGKVNWNKFKEAQLAGLGDAMAAEWQKHNDALTFFNEISGVRMGQRDPSEFGANMDDEGNYAGYHRTAPIINSFKDAFGCKSDGSSNFRSGKTNVWALFPGAVPLFSASGNHMSDWAKYWDFFMKFAESWPTKAKDFRFSIGSYSTTAKFTPRGYKFRANTPFSRMQKYYKKPSMNAARPKLFSTLRSVLTYLPRYGVSTPAAGDNCVLFWFFQDVPRDLNDFLVPEEYEMIREMHSLCTVIPIMVGPDSGSAAWQSFAANLMPGLQSKYAKDPDYNGVFNVASFDDLTSAELHAHVNDYLCLVENRATCRTVADAWQPPSSEMSTDSDPTEGFRAVVEDYDDSPAEAAGTQAASEAASTEEATTAKVPEIDSCCGHDGTKATAFDSELRTCCEDGQVRAYEYEGDDPCLSSDFFK